MAWISSEGLGKYLNSSYPEMKFCERKYEYKNTVYATVFRSGISKDVYCEFNTVIFSEEDFEKYGKDIWNDRTLVDLSFEKHKGGYSCSGWAVDNRKEMENGIALMVKKVKDALGIKEPKMRQLTIEEVLADMERGQQ